LGIGACSVCEDSGDGGDCIAVAIHASQQPGRRSDNQRFSITQQRDDKGVRLRWSVAFKFLQRGDNVASPKTGRIQA
jgi:hypothetical protein